MAQYRLFTGDHGRSVLEPIELLASPFENGPGEFKGVGGVVLGSASRVMLMRFEPGAHPGFHRAAPAFAVLLEGSLVVSPREGDDVVLAPGDVVRVEAMERGAWRLGNPGVTDALFAVVPMPPPSSTVATEG